MGNVTLIIAEKPSLAKTIATALAKNSKFGYENGYIKVSDELIVSWAFGHLFSLEDMESYDSNYKIWAGLDKYPFLPDEFKSKISGDFQEKQLKIIKGVIKKFKVNKIVHAGDPDREGQLIIDDIIDNAKFPQNNVMRLIVTDFSPDEIRKSYANMKPNSDYKSWHDCAILRRNLDWYVGMNGTRILSNLLGQRVNELKIKTPKAGFFRYGRVYTATLKLVINRCDEIENFKSKPFFNLNLKADSEDLKLSFKLMDSIKISLNKPQAEIDDIINCKEPLNKLEVDSESRILNKSQIQNLDDLVKSNINKIKFEAKTKEIENKYPSGFTLSDLQNEVSKVFNLDIETTRKISQSLYEQGYITYTRTDNRYYTDDDYSKRHSIIKGFEELVNSGSLKEYGLDNLNGISIDSNIKSPNFNSDKVQNHSGIAPTVKTPDFSKLDDKEKSIYLIVLSRYIQQFLPKSVKEELSYTATLNLDNTYIFSNTESRLIKSGFNYLNLKSKKFETESNVKSKLNNSISNLNGLSWTTEISEHKTTPPKYFTEVTLLNAMSNISAHFKPQTKEEENIKRILKDTNGLGTEATRTDIISKIINDDIIKVVKGELRVNSKKSEVVKLIPNSSSSPFITGFVEQQLKQVADGEVDVQKATNVLFNFFTKSLETFKTIDMSNIKLD